jgi:hypothetical protein
LIIETIVIYFCQQALEVPHEGIEQGMAFVDPSDTPEAELLQGQDLAKAPTGRSDCR